MCMYSAVPPLSQECTANYVHIPPFPGSMPVLLTEQVQQEREMKEARNAAFAAFRGISTMGKHIVHADTSCFYEQKVLPFVVSKLPSVHYKVQKCYALVLTIAKLGSMILCHCAWTITTYTTVL